MEKLLFTSESVTEGHPDKLCDAFHALPDRDGTFRIADVKDGKYNLLVRLVGYDLYNCPGIVLDAVSKAVDLGTIAMKPLEVGLAEVEVVAQKKQVIYKLDKKVIEASSNLLAGGGSAVDILENTPSIRVDAEGEVSFRGSTGFTVYVDGKPSVFSGTQALEQIPAGHIENIEIITTPSARHHTAKTMLGVFLCYDIDNPLHLLPYRDGPKGW